MSRPLFHLISIIYKPIPNTVLITNGLLEYQALHFAYLSCLLFDEPPCLTVISESQFSASTLLTLKKLAPNTSFRIVDLSKHWTNSILVKVIRIAIIAPPALLLSVVTNRSSLLSSYFPWFLSQVMHGIWDSSLRYSSNNTVSPSIAQRFFSALPNLSQLTKAAHISCTLRPSVIFLGHSVYSGRSSLALYRMLPIPVYVHSFHTLNKVDPDFDSSLFTPSPKESQALLSIARTFDPKPFWDSRLSGHSTYYDAQKSFDGIQSSETTPVNVVYLHIFKDSPFNHIDRKRIFADYFQWIKTTLQILAASGEQWLLKTHPTSSRWGENSLTIINTLITDLFPNGLPSHILIDECTLSNSSLLAHARRVVTFSGSVHVEAAAHSIKPIVISSTLLECIDPSLVHKPKTINDYEALLLAPSCSVIFQLSSHETSLSRQILQLKENNLTYGNDYNILPLYPSDSPNYQTRVLECFLQSIEDNKQLTKKLALYLGKGLTRTTAQSVLDSFYSLMSSSSFPTSL